MPADAGPSSQVQDAVVDDDFEFLDEFYEKFDSHVSESGLPSPKPFPFADMDHDESSGESDDESFPKSRAMGMSNAPDSLESNVDLLVGNELNESIDEIDESSEESDDEPVLEGKGKGKALQNESNGKGEGKPLSNKSNFVESVDEENLSVVMGSNKPINELGKVENETLCLDYLQRKPSIKPEIEDEEAKRQWAAAFSALSDKYPIQVCLLQSGHLSQAPFLPRSKRQDLWVYGVLHRSIQLETETSVYVSQLPRCVQAKLLLLCAHHRPVRRSHNPRHRAVL